MSLKISWLKILLVAILFSLIDVTTKAQIAPDGTIPTDVTTPDRANFTIEGGDRVGANLFHSFSQFSVPNGGSANFNNASDINNIINRVTGGSISSIDGLIKANGTANLFLINPAGIVFGAGAKLDIGGSFLASSADSLLFSDGNIFSAIDPQNKPLLTINAPIGLQIRENPVAIQLQKANLAVKSGQNLTLVGGNLNFDGSKLTAPGGQIRLGGLASTGRVEIAENGNLSFPSGIRLADVFLTNGASVDVRADGKGAIAINARNLTLDKESFLAAGIGSGVGNTEAQAGDININVTELTSIDNGFIDNGVNENATGNAGQVNLTTGELSLTNRSRIGNSTKGQGNAGNISINTSGKVSLDRSNIQSQVQEKAVGRAGNLEIVADSLDLNNQSQLLADTNGIGDAGNITINTKNATAVAGNSLIFNRVGRTAQGNAGGININAGSFSLAAGAGNDFSQVISDTEGKGNAGDININATNSISIDRGRLLSASGVAGINPEGNAGDITLSAPQIDFKNFSFVSAATPKRVTGEAGNITLNGDNLRIREGSIINTLTETTFKGGDINVNAKTLEINTGGKIVTATVQKGDAGNVNLNVTDRILLDGSNPFKRPPEVQIFEEPFLNDLELNTGLFANTTDTATGNGGSIVIGNPKSTTISNGAKISVASQGQGNSGKLTIQTDNLTLGNGGAIEASTASGEGGNASLLVKDVLKMRDDSLISARAKGNANGGNINIDAGFVVAFEGGNNDIIANAERGNGGNIEISTESMFGLQKRRANPFTNDIDASSDYSLDGNVSIDTPDINPAQGTIALPESVVAPEEVTAQACDSENTAQNRSSLIITGKGGMPNSPSEPLVDYIIRVGESRSDRQSQLNKTQSLNKNISLVKEQKTFGTDEIIPARGMIVNEKGQVVLTAYPTPNADRSLLQGINNCISQQS
jgi:filamentous hemagglutinin family protein